MSEKIKTIILIGIFILVIALISVFMNSRNSANQILNNTNSNSQNIEKKIIEVNETNFEEEVLNSDKKVLIDFYATWCGPCKLLKPIIQEISNENKNIKVVEIDVDKSEALAYKYAIQAMPTLVVMHNGKEINRSVGLISKEKILEIL